MNNQGQHKTKYPFLLGYNFSTRLSAVFIFSFVFPLFLPCVLTAEANGPSKLDIQAIYINGELKNDRLDSIWLCAKDNLVILYTPLDQAKSYYYLHNYDTVYKETIYPLAIYNNLEKGTYQFNLSLTPIIHSSTAKKMVIIVDSSFFDEWGFFPFLLLYLTILFGGAGYIVLISNLRNQNKFSELRTDWTNKLHNDIGAELSSITMRLSSLKRKLGTQPNLQKNVLKVGKTINKIQSQLRTAFNLIDEQKISIHIVLSDIQNFAEENCELEEIELSFNNQLTFNKTYKVDERRTNILHSIMKEGISNLVKYAQGDRASINIAEEKDGIKVLIEDDGIGFNTNQSFSSNGIHNLKSYGQKGAMDVNIQSIIDEGTTISIFIPYL